MTAPILLVANFGESDQLSLRTSGWPLGMILLSFKHKKGQYSQLYHTLSSTIKFNFTSGRHDVQFDGGLLFSNGMYTTCIHVFSCFISVCTGLVVFFTAPDHTNIVNGIRKNNHKVLQYHAYCYRWPHQTSTQKLYWWLKSSVNGKYCNTIYIVTKSTYNLLFRNITVHVKC